MSFKHWGTKIKDGNEMFTSGGIYLIKCCDFPKVISIDEKFNNFVILEKIIEIHNSPIPVCWNYSFEEYPPEYLKLFHRKLSKNVIFIRIL